jgi:hypothetical protein
MVFVPPKDRVLEHSTSNSQTVFTVTGAIDTSFNAFSAWMSIGDTTIGGVVEPGVAFKSGKLTYSATNEITIDSTGYDSKGTFSAGGTKEVFMGMAALVGGKLQAHGADIASAATLNLETAAGDVVDVTGTTTITAITLSEGHERTVRFTGALLLTNGASLVLPGGQNITTVAGAFAIFRGYASGVVRCVSYSPAAGQLGIDPQTLSSAQQLQVQKNAGVSAPVAGDARNLKIVPGSATTLTVTADEIIMETALGGQPYRGASFSKTLDISGTGAGKMDTSSPPTSGFIAVYAITKGDGSTFDVLGYSLGVFASGTLAPTIYPGSNMPSGYVASALIGIWPTNGSAQFATTAVQYNRKFWPSAPVQVFSGTGNATLTSLSIAAAVPASAKSCDVMVASTQTGVSISFTAAGNSAGAGQKSCFAITASSTFAMGPLTLSFAWPLPDIPIITAQTIFLQDPLTRSSDLAYVTAFTF